MSKYVVGSFERRSSSTRLIVFPMTWQMPFSTLPLDWPRTGPPSVGWPHADLIGLPAMGLMCTAVSGTAIEVDGARPATGWASAAISSSRAMLHALTFGGPTGTVSKGRIFALSSDPKVSTQTSEDEKNARSGAVEDHFVAYSHESMRCRCTYTFVNRLRYTCVPTTMRRRMVPYIICSTCMSSQGL